MDCQSEEAESLVPPLSSRLVVLERLRHMVDIGPNDIRGEVLPLPELLDGRIRSAWLNSTEERTIIVKKSLILAALTAATLVASPVPVAADDSNVYTVQADDHLYVRRGGYPAEWGCIQHHGKLVVFRSGGQVRVACRQGDGDYPPSSAQPRQVEGETVWLAYRQEAWFQPGEGVRKLRAERVSGTVHVFAVAGKGGK
jgi:hypothetical protein